MKKILIVEDDKKIALAPGKRLGAWGYQVAFAPNAVTATNTARNYEPDLILMDIGLPGGDGFTVAHRLSTIDNTSDVPVVYITASKKYGLQQKAMELGRAGFL